MSEKPSGVGRGGVRVASTELIIWLSLTIVGFIILLMSFFAGHDFGGGDVGGGDFGGHELGGGHDLAGATSPGLSPLSMPMIAAFLSTAGAAGAALTVSGFDTGTASLIAVIAGVGVFLGAFLFVAKFLGDSQSSSIIHEKEYEGKTGTVTETIPEDGVGAIAVTVRGTRYVVTAKSEGPKIPMGRDVLVKRVDNSIALVEEMRAS